MLYDARYILPASETKVDQVDTRQTQACGRDEIIRRDNFTTHSPANTDVVSARPFSANVKGVKLYQGCATVECWEETRLHAVLRSRTINNPTFCVICNFRDWEAVQLLAAVGGLQLADCAGFELRHRAGSSMLAYSQCKFRTCNRLRTNASKIRIFHLSCAMIALQSHDRNFQLAL